MKAELVTREEVSALIEEAKTQKKSKRDHVSAKLVAKYPGIDLEVIRRNGREYNALEYLLNDLESYG